MYKTVVYVSMVTDGTQIALTHSHIAGKIIRLVKSNPGSIGVCVLIEQPSIRKL